MSLNQIHVVVVTFCFVSSLCEHSGVLLIQLIAEYSTRCLTFGTANAAVSQQVYVEDLKDEEHCLYRPLQERSILSTVK